MNPDSPNPFVDRLSTFLHRPLDTILRERLAVDPRNHAMALFSSAVANVPAYRQFLLDRGVVPESVTRFDEFGLLPLADKTNYIEKYPLPQRCKAGRIQSCDRLAVSSGSTGASTCWPRATIDELDVALRFEHVFRQSFRAFERNTLAIVCFPLGNWVGGIYTASCCWHLAQKGYPLVVATPGNKIDEILRVVREMGPHFDQTVLLGYPPFIKDVVDTGLACGIDWRIYPTRFVFAGEVFSEEWRTQLLRRVGSDSPCHDSASLYGTADAGVLGNETPLSIAIRRCLAEKPDLARKLFGESRLPTLVQYDPMSRFIEVIDGSTLAITADNGVPLIRYHIGDRGGMLSYPEMMAFVSEHGISPREQYALDSEDIPLPFVWVFGRADFTVSFYGANIYPENVIVGLEQPEFSNQVSGKFVMTVRSDDKGGKFLHVVVELLTSATPGTGIQHEVASSIRSQLLRLNSEFANYVPEDRQMPCVEFRDFGDPEYFPAGVKHRYTRRS